MGQCWVIVGAWLGFGWQLMLGQRLSNEQSNVGPTKYVAVGPTLNQQLGFGWRMVSVLAGAESVGVNHLILYSVGIIACSLASVRVTSSVCQPVQGSRLGVIVRWHSVTLTAISARLQRRGTCLRRPPGTRRPPRLFEKLESYCIKLTSLITRYSVFINYAKEKNCKISSRKDFRNFTNTTIKMVNCYPNSISCILIYYDRLIGHSSCISLDIRCRF